MKRGTTCLSLDDVLGCVLDIEKSISPKPLLLVSMNEEKASKRHRSSCKPFSDLNQERKARKRVREEDDTEDEVPWKEINALSTAPNDSLGTSRTRCVEITHMGIDVLPDECWLHIFSFVPVPTLLDSVMCVNRRFYSLLKTDEYFWHHQHRHFQRDYPVLLWCEPRASADVLHEEGPLPDWLWERMLNFIRPSRDWARLYRFCHSLHFAYSYSEHDDMMVDISWHDRDGNYHRDFDLPAVREPVWGAICCYRHGELHCDGDNPAIRTEGQHLCWLKRNQFYRDNDQLAFECAKGICRLDPLMTGSGDKGAVDLLGNNRNCHTLLPTGCEQMVSIQRLVTYQHCCVDITFLGISFAQ